MEDFNLDAFESFAKIVVIGVGGGGCNAVNQMVKSNLRGVTFWAINTDAQALATSKAEHRYILGKDITNGLGAGGNPNVGKAAADASEADIMEIVQGANMVFVAAGMGGGTGTGAAPVVAKIAKDCGALTIAIVTRPFSMEGEKRKKNAVEGIARLKDNVDSMIIISNDKLMMMDGTKPISEAFAEADRVLSQSIRTITDLIVLPGLINVDYADVKATLENKGMALIGFGKGKGEKKAYDATSQALSSPLYEASIQGAHSALINVACGKSVTLDDTKVVMDLVAEACGNNPNIIMGTSINSEVDDEIMVSIVATEFDKEFDPFEDPVIDTTVSPIEPKVEQVAEEIAEEDEDDDDILPSFLK